MTAPRLIAIALLSGAVALAAVAQGTISADPEPEQALKPVKLMTVEASKTAISRQFFGRVAAKKTVDLAFQVGGQIRSFPVLEGQSVARGEVIAQLDLRNFELALEQARLSKEQADRTVDRLRKLKGSTVSQVSIDDAETAANLAEIAVENAEIALEDATLHAPFDALVASRSVENFTTINAGTPVVRLHDMSELRVEIDVPEVLVQKAGLADDVQVTARFPASDEIFDLEVRELKAETSNIGQTYRATFGMAPPEGLGILPGSSVTVWTELSKESKGIVIPASAVHIDPDGSTWVFRYEPKGAAEGTLTRRSVTLEPSDTGEVHVLDGIEAGDEIVLAGVNALEDGMAARRFVGFGN
ncbi:RND family efflux transporter MFP subunit [Aliiruegeria haliotis]|uniref:RND family efflux transporter MFP subunit n=1 Tax=Aliiruegeria haliotis TaxID=1280846 RepID=A0A2T0RYC5_9RHOB|nr:efflux RND transporter periplasmic adaptor subunit [Aliiruegeria haliotis]PRY26160.1 RND family efflux transporter MFP subunit [Aliiruegeria haliotis]